MSREADRQRALLAALAGDTEVAGVAGAATPLWRGSDERAARGLAVYRANAAAAAERALCAAFPTVCALVGDDDFRHLSAEFAAAHPAERGDLGEWGDALPGFVEAHAGLARWPWLGDCARLDLARHRCERAADAAPDLASIGLLGSADPARLRLEPVPGCALLRSAWPLDAIHRAHRLDGDAAALAFAEVRDAIDAGRGETVLVVRRGWRAEVHLLDETAATWWADLLAGRDLGAALERAGAAFDFAAWLAEALREAWLERVVDTDA